MDLNSIKTEKDVIEALKHKTQFEIDVPVAAFRIPKGKVSTYKRVAEKIGRPNPTGRWQMLSTRTRFGPLFHATPFLRMSTSRVDPAERKSQPAHKPFPTFSTSHHTRSVSPMKHALIGK